MTLRSLLFAGAALMTVAAPLTANAAETRGHDRDGYGQRDNSGWRDDRRHDLSAAGLMRRIDYLQREAFEGRRAGWLNHRDADRVGANLRALRDEVRRASYRFGNRLSFPVAQRFDTRMDDVERLLTRAEQWGRHNDRDGRGGDLNRDDRDGQRRDGQWRDNAGLIR